MRGAPGEVRDIVYGAMFTRGESTLKTALSLLADQMSLWEKYCLKRQWRFFGNTRVSVMMDSNGCNTTAAAAVRKILSAVYSR
jgi:hypothetical protein